jgi:hypothetical protein
MEGALLLNVVVGQSQVLLVRQKTRRGVSTEHMAVLALTYRFLSCILALASLTGSESSISSVMILSVRVFTKICMPLRRQRTIQSRLAMGEAKCMRRRLTEMESALLLNAVVGQSVAILKLLSRRCQTLLVGRNAGGEVSMERRAAVALTYPSLSGILVLGVTTVPQDSILSVMVLPVRVFTKICMPLRRQRTIQSRLATGEAKCTRQPLTKMESALLLNAVVRQSAAVLKLLSRGRQALLVWRNARRGINTEHKVVLSVNVPSLVLGPSLRAVDSTTAFNLERDGRASEVLYGSSDNDVNCVIRYLRLWLTSVMVCRKRPEKRTLHCECIVFLGISGQRLTPPPDTKRQRNLSVTTTLNGWEVMFFRTTPAQCSLEQSAENCNVLSNNAG